MPKCLQQKLPDFEHGKIIINDKYGEAALCGVHLLVTIGYGLVRQVAVRRKTNGPKIPVGVRVYPLRGHNQHFRALASSGLAHKSPEFLFSASTKLTGFFSSIASGE